MDVEKYDEYVRGPAREVITVETGIESTNKGFVMLEKLGWSEGQPLGLSADGKFDDSYRELRHQLGNPFLQPASTPYHSKSKMT
jgi:hypothetical protein